MQIISSTKHILINWDNFQMKFSILGHCVFSLLSSSYSPLILILSNSTLFPSWKTYYFMWWNKNERDFAPWSQVQNLATLQLGKKCWTHFQLWQLSKLGTFNFGNFQFWHFSNLTTFSFEIWNFCYFQTKILNGFQEQI